MPICKNTSFILLCAATLILILLNLQLPGGIRTAAGFLYLALLPGYALQQGLFPDHPGPGWAVKVLFAIALSFAAVPLLLLVLSYTAAGVGLRQVYLIVYCCILAASLVGIYRAYTQKVPPRSPPAPLKHQAKGWVRYLRRWRITRTDLAGTVVLLVSIGLLVISVTGALAEPADKTGSAADFYILGAEGLIEELDLSLITLGVINNGNEADEYLVEIKEYDRPLWSSGSFKLEKGECREEKINLAALCEKKGQYISFSLYEAGDSSPLRALHLWMEGSGDNAGYTRSKRYGR